MSAYWEHFPHGADIGVRGYGETLAEAFEKAALAMAAVITDPAIINPTHPIEVTAEASDSELLLADWLNSLVYEMATRKMLFSRFVVDIKGQQLRATAWGEKVDTARHHPRVEVKGATYTELRVAQNEDGNWVAQCVVDV